jgi:tRNA A37 methylthiotransferase MiaB
MEVFKHSPLQYAHIFSYSARDETRANLMKDQFIHGKKIERRSKVLRSMSHEMRKRFSNRCVGAVENQRTIIIKQKAEDLGNQIRSVHSGKKEQGWERRK